MPDRACPAGACGCLMDGMSKMTALQSSAGRHHGVTLVYSVVALSLLFIFVSLGIDLGRVQLAKTELQRAADAAARYAVSGMAQSVSTAQDYATTAAAQNLADGSNVSLNVASDIEFGTWDESSKTFTVLTGSARANANSIRVTARRTAANGNAVPLLFAQVLGRSSCDVTAVAIARITYSGTAGLIGLDGITVKNNAFIASYNSDSTTSPSKSNFNSYGGLASNGQISGGNNNVVKGGVTLGPGGSLSDFTLTGSTSTLASDIEVPEVPEWNPAPNPNGISQNYTVNSNTTLPGGTYWFTSLTVNKPLSFSGAATLNVNGNVIVDDDLTAFASKPNNLKIYQIGSNRTFGDDKGNHIDITAVVIAPTSDFVSKNNAELKGAFTFKSVEAKNNIDVFYDEAISGGTATGATTIATVK